MLYTSSVRVPQSLLTACRLRTSAGARFALTQAYLRCSFVIHVPTELHLIDNQSTWRDPRFIGLGLTCTAATAAHSRCILYRF